MKESIHPGITNGKPETEFNYVKDVKTGRYSKYYFNGVLEESGEYDNEGNLTGEFKSFDRDGNMATVQKEYKKGLLDGTCIEYFPGWKGTDETNLQTWIP